VHDLDRDIIVPTSGNAKAPCPFCGPTRSNPRDRSLSVSADGVYLCHHCQAKGKVGGGDPNGYGAPLGRPSIPKVYTPPPPIVPAPTQDKLRVFFDGRGIPPEVVARNGITLGEDGGIKFPYLRDGELVNVKTRYPGKKFAMAAGAELIFYGLDDCATAHQVVIVEGEMDKLAIESAGITTVLSVPNGASTGAMSYMASAEALFDRCHSVVIAVDHDDKGMALETELARRIGHERCYRVRWPLPCKDANEVLQAHGADALVKMLADANPFPIAGITEIDDVFQDMLEARNRGAYKGATTGWPSLDHLFTVKTGEFTVISGIPGHGKGEFTENLLLHLAATQGWPFAVFSPENYPRHKLFSKLCGKALGKPWTPGATPCVTDAEALAWKDDWAKHHVFAITPDEATVDEILDAARRLIFRSGIKLVMIDPWNQVDHSGKAQHDSETQYISQAITKFSTFARTHDVHLFVVAHPTKLYRDKEGHFQPPDPYDIAGSASWYSKADNIIAVHRDKADDGKPVEIIVQKIRYDDNGRIGRCLLQFDPITKRYTDLGRWDTTQGGTR